MPTNHTNNSQFYDRIAKAYDLIADSSEHQFRQDGVRAMELADDARVLEIGFGTGNALIEIAAELGPAGKVEGIDISSGMRDMAQGKIDAQGLGDKVHVQVASAVELPFDDESFDAAFQSFTLELFDEDDFALVLAEAARVLKPGGKFGNVSLVTTADGAQESLITKGYKWSHRHFPHIVDCRPVDAVGLLEQAGFEIVVNQRESMWELPVGIIVARRR